MIFSIALVFNCIPLMFFGSENTDEWHSYLDHTIASIESEQNELYSIDKIDIPGELSLYRNVFAGIYFIACEGDEGVCFSIDLDGLSGDGGIALEVPAVDKSMRCERMDLKRSTKGVRAQFFSCK